ncbi:MAG: hypothetical protein DMF00_04750 [Verrucomicrobia bacterium]|nr:MAG: hypothetical protein DMF00_04750 [Verrucomicrobiota bacterium]
MARPLRIEYPGAIYHVLSRGDRREAIFRTEADRKLFLNLLDQTCRRTGWQIHAYCLMDNHFHLVVETPRGNLSTGMQWFLGSYTQRFNRRHRLWGHLFGGRYKALLVDGRPGGAYLRRVCDYVHLNPVRAGMLGNKEKVHRFRWSSYPRCSPPLAPPNITTPCRPGSKAAEGPYTKRGCRAGDCRVQLVPS